MPFIGRDWRSPGEAWVKTETLGWQRMKIIESQLYPGCHQNPTCSWPPNSEFGQHMASHCRRHDRTDNIGRNSSEFRDSLCSSNGNSDSSGESRPNSASPSPTTSPEKNVHHIYPITISSPYGQYSCCNHHYESRSPPKIFYHPCNQNDEQNNDNSQQTNAQKQLLSRSLSPDSVTISSSNNNHANSKNCIRLRYNNSVSDFRNSSSSSSSSLSSPTEDDNKNHETSTSHEQEVDSVKQYFDYDEQTISQNTPIIMKNTFKSNEQTEPRLTTQNQNLIQTNTCCCTTSNNHNSQNICHLKEPYVRTAPHCRISVRTREVAMYNTISEAFYRLDFCNAIHDIRRFNYICKLLHLLITQNLTSLSGCATKVLFTMLEQVAWEVSSNKRNIHVLKNLLNELRQMIQKYYCWGRPIGSSLLWQQHFDTIERISQIVDGIELSPPKSDTTQITFNNLPVEMIREILLRLNDYRDLVNSAQASPLMRSMIDGQYIWQQLCKYHFTEQQLKLALDKQNGLLVKENNSKQRGVKYARTTSADGLTSFRNPVSHKVPGKGDKGFNCGTTSTTRQQIEQTSGRRGNRQSSDTTDNDASTSYVTRAIKIFDKEGSSMTLGTSKLLRKTDTDKANRAQQQESKQHNVQASSKSGQSKSDLRQKQPQNRPLNSSRANHEIDWERVFHQLRKKFDLKEEYADCLLLCRHCRCLFWKSFGHPCIKNEDLHSQATNKHCSGFRPPFEHSCSVVNNSCNCDGLRRQQGNLEGNSHERIGQNQAQNENNDSNGNEQHREIQGRVSVAALSRNFDVRAQRINRSAVDLENIPPPLPPQLGEANSHDNGGHFSQQNQQQQQRRQQRLLQSSSNNDNLNCAREIRELSVRVPNRQQRLNGDNYNSSNNNNNNDNNNQRIAQGRSAAAVTLRRDELVPKHVAISPQAFLKFFSL